MYMLIKCFRESEVAISRGKCLEYAPRSLPSAYTQGNRGSCADAYSHARLFSQNGTGQCPAF